MIVFDVLISLIRDFQPIKHKACKAYNKENITFHTSIRFSNNKYPHKNTSIYIHFMKKMKSIYIYFYFAFHKFYKEKVFSNFCGD